MLILIRKPGQEIVIQTAAGEEIRIKVCDIEARDRVKIGITAPRSVSVVRAELIKKAEEEARNGRRNVYLRTVRRGV